MDTFTMVRPEHLNHHGYLFGGSMLKWVDEYAWLVAARDFPGCTLVTRGMDRIVFSKQVRNGSILRFSILPWKQGNSSVTYTVEVYADRPGGLEEEQVFSTLPDRDMHMHTASVVVPERFRHKGGIISFVICN